VTREQARRILDALAADVRTYRIKCALGPFAGGPLLRLDFEACSGTALTGAVEHFIDEVGPRLIAAGNFSAFERAARVANAQLSSELERMGAEQTTGPALERFRSEVIDPTVTTVTRGGMGLGVVAAVAYAVYRLTR
jgi:hypothetical protein